MAWIAVSTGPGTRVGDLPLPDGEGGDEEDELDMTRNGTGTIGYRIDVDGMSLILKAARDCTREL